MAPPRTSRLGSAKLPLLIHADGEPNLPALLRSERAFFDAMLLEHGALLFRGFGVATDADFERAARAVSPELLDYVYGSTPRTGLGSGIYTATEYRASAHIPFHNEQSYAVEWPLKIMFACLQPAQSGGETPLADSVKVSERLAPEVRDEFRRRRIMYVRNYGLGVDVPWQKAFLTDQKAEVEAYCRRYSIEFEWGADTDRLRTRQVCDAFAVHPRTHREIWFNQVHLFHVSSIDPAAREAMLAVFEERDLPRNAYFGDGGRIPDSLVDAVRAAYEPELVSFPWQRGDFLLADNMLVAHSRTPYVGPRTVHVAMAEPWSVARARAATA